MEMAEEATHDILLSGNWEEETETETEMGAEWRRV